MKKCSGGFIKIFGKVSKKVNTIFLFINLHQIYSISIYTILNNSFQISLDIFISYNSLS